MEQDCDAFKAEQVAGQGRKRGNFSVLGKDVFLGSCFDNGISQGLFQTPIIRGLC